MGGIKAQTPVSRQVFFSKPYCLFVRLCDIHSSMQVLIAYMNVTGLSQIKLAERLGVDPGQINHWIQGRRSPSAENLKLISERTGITLEKLVEDL